MTEPATATQDWPKTYLLQVHSEAVKHGFIFIQPISEADAASLRSRLYRIRRRSDTSTAAFILPEYHMVTVGQWQPGPDGQGRLPITYNKLASGVELPAIVPATSEEAEPAIAPPALTPSSIRPIEPEDLQLDTQEVSNYVADMIRKAKERSNG